ncbi:MAG TPA: DUF4287 domain-containing protein [Thermoanaerobaculia bacterium]|nr:DUF4287 domain-containing protein [Thermoanaerobaculia bacterium]
MPTSDEMVATMLANIKEKTGKEIHEWLDVVKKAAVTKHGEIVKYLKSEHGLTHGYANLVAHQTHPAEAPAEAAAGGEEQDPAADQYTGNKAALRPIYDTLMENIRKFGNDIELAPKKGYVSLRRKKQFALIQPSTATRVDVGLNAKGIEPTGALEASGSWNAMVTHRIRLAAKEEVTPQVIDWLKKSYDAAG